MNSHLETSIDLANSSDNRAGRRPAAGFNSDEGCGPLNCDTCFSQRCEPREDAGTLFSEVF